jgi:ferritin-like metal-binding protein YciE
MGMKMKMMMMRKSRLRLRSTKRFWWKGAKGWRNIRPTPHPHILMAMKIKSLRDLFIHQLRDLFSAEKQLVKALPKFAKAATNEELKETFEEHLRKTEEHVERLEQIFEALEISSRGDRCAAMEGLIAEAQSLMKEEMPPAVLDAALVACAQRVEHYEIAAYGSARTFAEVLDIDEATDVLEETLEDEKEADIKLTELADEVINVEALDAGADDAEEAAKE